jgi:hypothetical protein
MRIALEELKTRFKQAEESVDYFADRTTIIMESEDRIKKMKESEQRLGDLWNTLKHVNKHTVGIPDKKERKGQKDYLKK